MEAMTISNPSLEVQCVYGISGLWIVSTTPVIRLNPKPRVSGLEGLHE